VDPNILAAIISAASSAAVAITALVLNQRGFTTLENRMSALENRVDRRLESLEGKVDVLMQKFYELDNRVSRMEDKLNLPPR
jgi:hypothetical protein